MMYLAPMLLKKINKSLPEAYYLNELKLDGIRLLYSNIDDKPKLYTRHNNDVTTRFPEIVRVQVPPGTVLDGEVIRITIYAESLEFAIRYYVPEEDDDYQYPGIWGHFDLTIDKKYSSEIIHLLPKVGANYIYIRAKDYFDKNYAGRP